MVTLGLSAVVRELQGIARRLGSDAVAAAQMSSAASATPRDQFAENTSFPGGRDQPGAVNPSMTDPGTPFPPPWHQETTARERTRNEAPPAAAETASAARQRRDLMFSSTSRKKGGHAETRVTDLSPLDPHPAPPSGKLGEAPPATFEDAWPQPERARGPDLPTQRRSGRTPSTFAEPDPGSAGSDHEPSAAHDEDQPAVTVLKSGVVEGMAYSLYSDGSIEAQMPEGMMRFASIDELRAHLDQRS